jgi:4-amino-4-deoxy-L-arabinose transferase-like glycosyltransferase
LYQPLTPQPHPQRILLCILLTAFLLRIWGIWNADTTDEYNEVFEALRVCSGHLNFERWGKRFYLYLLSLEFGIYFLIGWMLQIFQSPADFAAHIVRNLNPLLLLGRITSAVFGTASIFLTYLIGKSLFNSKAGLIASVFLCFNVVNIELSHYARVDATLCAVVLTSFYFIACILKSESPPRSKYYILAGLFSGIAFQTKQPAIILLIPFVFSHCCHYQEKSSLSIIFNSNICVFSLAFLLGLIIGNPAIIFAPQKFIAFQLGMSRVYTEPIQESESGHIGFVVYLIYFYKELGPLLLVVSAYSLFRSIFSGLKEDIVILSFIIPFYLLMGSSRYMVSFSYMIPLMPLLYILIGKELAGLWISLQQVREQTG